MVQISTKSELMLGDEVNCEVTITTLSESIMPENTHNLEPLDNTEPMCYFVP